MHHGAMSEHMLPTVEHETAHQPNASIIWLHGLGADGHDFEPIIPELDLSDQLRVRFVFPHAPSIPVSINGGYIMPAWYDIRNSDLGIEHDAPGIERSIRQVKLLIEQEQMRGIAAGRIIIAGFSQGASMALRVGLTHRDKLAGMISLSGYLLQRDRLADLRTAENQDTPVFLAHGIDDSIVPLVLGEKARDTLVDWKYPVQWHSYSMSHQICAEEIQAVGKWISERLNH